MTEIDDEPKFTEGPWKLEVHRNGCVFVTIEHSPVGDICDLYHKTIDGRGVFTKENAVENGYLIAAAPDLYKALADLLNDVSDSRGVRQRGLRALKLARGEAVPPLDE